MPVAGNAHLNQDALLYDAIAGNQQPVPYFAEIIKSDPLCYSLRTEKCLVPLRVLRIFLVRSFILNRLPLFHTAGRTTLGIV